MLQILIAPLAAAIISQLTKFLIKSNGLKLNRQSLSTYAGMPSSHAAMAASLCMSVGLTQGFNSPLFFVCIIFSVFIIRDALGLRNYVGANGKTINYLTNKLISNKMVEAENQSNLPEKVGHTTAQVVAGVILGILISMIIYYISNIYYIS